MSAKLCHCPLLLLLVVLWIFPSGCTAIGGKWQYQNPSCLAPRVGHSHTAVSGTRRRSTSGKDDAQDDMVSLDSNQPQPQQNAADTSVRVSVPPRSSKKLPSFDIVRLKNQREHGKRQRSVRAPSRPRSRSRSTTCTSGTRFDLRPPSCERIAKWFAPTSSSTSENGRRGLQSTFLFNHDSVGMTNPVVQVSAVSSNNHRQEIDSMDTTTSEVTLAAASTSADTTATSTTTTSTLQVHDTWIPASSSTSTTSSLAPRSSSARVVQYKVQRSSPLEASREAAERAWFPATNCNNNHNNKWRQCRFRRRVGQGQDCYERVRDAAVAWQFQHDNGRKGILPVPQLVGNEPSDNDCFALNDRASQQVLPLWSGPHTLSSRRLVTYLSTGFKSKWLPKLYTMNPVMVIYDLLDQRGPGTTYTSTAYATLRGHLLRGEERVTVAFRDDTGFVDVEILSFSGPAKGSLRAKCVWPLIGRQQRAFFQHQLDFLEQVATRQSVAATTTTTTPIQP